MVPKIDFLPPSYHQRRRRTQKQVWRRGLLAVFLGLIVLGTFGLQSTHSDLRHTRDRLQQQAKAMHGQLGDPADLQHQIRGLDAEANIVARLRLHVPPTRVLAIVIQSLPKHVSLTELRLHRESIDRQSETVPGATGSEDAEKLLAELDLQRLEAAAEGTAQVVLLKGMAPDDVSISVFLAALQHSGAFSEVQLDYTNQQQFQDTQLRSFAIHLRLRQPGAPSSVVDAPTGGEGPVARGSIAEQQRVAGRSLLDYSNRTVRR